MSATSCEDKISLLDLPLIALESILASPLLGAWEIKSLRTTCRQCMGLIDRTRIRQLHAAIPRHREMEGLPQLAQHQAFVARCHSLKELSVHVLPPSIPAGGERSNGPRRGIKPVDINKAGSGESGGAFGSPDPEGHDFSGEDEEEVMSAAAPLPSDGLRAVQRMFAAAMATTSLGWPSPGGGKISAGGYGGGKRGERSLSGGSAGSDRSPESFPSPLSDFLEACLPGLVGLDSLSLHLQDGEAEVLSQGQWTVLEEQVPESCRCGEV